MQEDIQILFSYLQPIRVRESTKGQEELLEATESDKGRVINSSAFRRLQQKTQVFPLEANASVRSRLTHSIEVAHIGRYIAQTIIKKFSKDNKNFIYDFEKITAFINTVETACLLHDIGNPPFGHLGEVAIQKWFQCKNIETDLVDFDGNPQGFRLISSGSDEVGLNLTCSLLLSTIKYPYTAAKKLEGKKFGVFQLCYESYKEICKKLNWVEGKPFPLMCIMDTADEIAYSVSDLEDAIEKQIVKEKDIISHFYNFCNENEIKDVIQQDDNFLKFKTSLINLAVKHSAENFCRKLKNILDGEKVELIEDNTNVSLILKEIYSFARQNIYSHESAEKLELAGRNIIQGILNHFEPLLNLSNDDFSLLISGDSSIRIKKLDFELRLFRLLPKNHLKIYETNFSSDESKEKLFRAHLIVDYVSGMTDGFALEIYQLLEGIRIQ